VAYYYVKDDGSAESGTATGDGGRYASQKTGDWSTAFTATTEYYASIGAAFAATTAPADGDYILCSDLHNKSYDNGTSPTNGDDISIISVDDQNCENYKPGAKENLTDVNDDYTFNGANQTIFLAGLDLETGDDVINLINLNQNFRAIDCIFRPDSSGDIAINQGSGDGSYVELLNVDIIGNSTEAIGFKLREGTKVVWRGGSASTITTLFTTSLSGHAGEITGVDLSSITTWVDSFTVANDELNYLVQNCKLNASLSLGQPTIRSQRLELYNCDDTSGGSFHRFIVRAYAGEAVNNDSTYVTTTESWYDGSDKSSIEVTTTANCSHTTPFVFELPAQYVDLSDTASDVLTIDILSYNTLTDTDIAAFLVYPDGTTAVQANWVTSGKTVGTGNYGVDPLAAGTTLSASSLGAGDWTGDTASPTPNFYKMELDTSGDAGQATAVSIRIEVYKASIASGDLFIHPIITVS